MRHCYSVIAVTKVIEDIIANREFLSPGIVSSMDRFICESYYKAEHGSEIKRLTDEIDRLKEENSLLKEKNEHRIINRVKNKFTKYHKAEN